MLLIIAFRLDHYLGSREQEYTIIFNAYTYTFKNDISHF